MDSQQFAYYSRRMGFLGLFAWACLGVSLELAHAFKVAFFFSDDLTRLLLRLAHAHGVGLALIVLSHAAVGSELSSGRALRISAWLIPLGFLLGAIGHPEGDPSIGILLTPIGAALLIFALGRLSWRSWRGT